MGCPPTFAVIFLPASPITPGWKLTFPLTSVAPLFVTARQVELDPFFNMIGASGVFPRARGNLGSVQLWWDSCIAGTH